MQHLYSVNDRLMKLSTADVFQTILSFYATLVRLRRTVFWLIDWYCSYVNVGDIVSYQFCSLLFTVDVNAMKSHLFCSPAG